MATSRFGLIFFLSAALLWSFPEPVNAGQWLQGSLYLTDETGQRIYGEYVSIFLTSEKIPVPRYPGIDKLERHRRLDRINQMHLDFYKYFAQYRNKPGYLVANAESSDDGTFAFLNVPPGDYYVVVTFPAMIGGYKVAWQQRVTVAAGRIRHVTLDSHNLALPTDRRE